MTSPLDLITNTKRIQKLEELLAEAYADADEVLRPRVAQLEEQLAKYAEAHKEAVADEREACAKVCESQTEGFADASIWDEAALSCAAAIRARSNTKENEQ